MQPVARKPTAPGSRGCLRRYGGRPQPLVRLVCFPWCGAGASVYRRLASSLPEHIELLAVQLPGREERFADRKLVRMEKLIEHVIGDIIAIFDRPLVLFGHSMGALVAYEMALALKGKIGREPDGLIVSGHGSPDSTDLDARCWHTANEEELIAHIYQLGGTPSAVMEDKQVMRAFLPTLRADYEVLESYVCGAGQRLSCPLVACAGDQDAKVSCKTIDAWQRYTTGPTRIHWFSGDHFYLCSQPQELTRYLREWIGSSTEAIFSTDLRRCT